HSCVRSSACATGKEQGRRQQVTLCFAACLARLQRLRIAAQFIENTTSMFDGWRRILMQRGPVLSALSVFALFVAALSGCSGGGSSSSSSPPPPPPPLVSANDAARFLTQATLGPTDSSISAVMTNGYPAWIASPQATQAAASQRSYIDLRTAQILAADPKAQVQQAQFFETWWRQAVTGPDELRERVAFALSQIFVISMQDATVGKDIRGVADYYDMLTANAFGNYRTLLEKVTLHPQMGIYLTSLANQKENAATGLLPDENYARAVMH